MKQIATMTLLIALLALFPKQIIAQEKEAGSAAQLALYTKEDTSDATPSTDYRVLRLKAYLAKNNSPMTDAADDFVRIADWNNLDWRLVAAIAGTESTFGKFVPTNSFNAWGWAVFTGRSYGAAFHDWEDGIKTVSQGLKNNYYDKGLTSVEAMGTIYAASPVWATHVRYFMNELAQFRAKEELSPSISIKF